MSSYTVRVEGASDLRSALRAIQRDFPKQMRVIHKDVGEIVAKEARRRAPVLKTRPGTTSGKPGALRDSIKPQATQRQAVVKAGTNIRLVYAPIQEFGWPGHGIEPQPYLYPALAATQEQIIDQYEDGIDRLIVKASFR